MQVTNSAPRVLIVEPNKNALAVMARRVGEAGYRIIASDSASAAVAELYRVPVDLVIAELRMDAMSGDLCVLVCGRSASRWRAAYLATRSRLRSIRSRSTSAAGVSRLGNSIRPES